MRIGVPKEIKVHEYRVGLVPAAVRELVDNGHEVLVQTGAGAGIGFADADYQRVGAKIVATAADVFAAAEMIVKVKEPQPVECAVLRKGQVLFTYLHLAPDPRQTEALIKSGATCIAYETVTAPRRLAAAADADERSGGTHVDPGRRLLPAEGATADAASCWAACRAWRRRKVVILGGGVSGTHAAEMAVGLRRRRDRGRPLGQAAARAVGRSSARRVQHRVLDAASTSTRSSCDADLVIGAVLIAGAAAPKLVTRDMVRRMKAGRRAGGHRHRPGRLLRDQQADDARRADLRRGRRRPLLRRQHAGRRAAHLDLRAEQRHAALRAQARRSRLEGGDAGRSRTWRTASTCTKGTSPTRRWHRPSGCPIRLSRNS